MGTKIHALLIAALGILLVIIVLQNTEPTQTEILFFSFTMPRALLLFATAVVGFVLGVLSTFRFKR